MTEMPTTLSLTDEVLDGVSSEAEPPCLSLYQPTHRRHPENQQDPIRFRNLVKELDASLRQYYPAAETRMLLEPFEALSRDAEFWNHTLDGLVVLGAPGFFRTIRVPQRVGELAVVADSFHTKPLRRFLQSVDRFQVLALSLDRIRLLEGNRHALDEVELAPDVPRTIIEALGDELTGRHRTIYAGARGSSLPAFHGDGGKSDEEDVDTLRFFRAVDRAVLEHHSKPSGLPLLLAAVPEHHGHFHQISRNRALLAGGIRLNPDSLSTDELRGLAWRAVEPRYRARLASLREEFEQARSDDVASDDLTEVAEASASGRVETLLIDADRQIAGRLDGATGRVELGELSDPRMDDLLDDLSELVAIMGGTVLVIPGAGMPCTSGVAAIYRY